MSIGATLRWSFLTPEAWVKQVVTWAHQGGWRTYVMHDSRDQQWGTDTGWPDVFCADELGLGRGLVAIECKTGSGKEQPNQRAWREVLARAGVHCLVAYPQDADQVREVLLAGVPVQEIVRRATISKSRQQRKGPRR